MKFFSWLLNLFKLVKIEAPKIEAPKIEASKIEASKVEAPKIEAKLDPAYEKPTKIAIIVGHTAKSQGAVNYLGESEFNFNSRVAKKMKEHINKKYPKKNIKIFFREEGNYSAAVSKVGKDVGKFGASISMELHFNSFKQVAYGCEILVWEGAKDFKKTVKISDEITDKMSLKFKLKQRHKHNFPGITVGDGVKILATGDRGALNIKTCNDNGVTHAMLIEPCFANIESAESKSIFENEDKYVEFLAEELSKINL
jgi:N-acetylmuramoyl-L-alanine amidase